MSSTARDDLVQRRFIQPGNRNPDLQQTFDLLEKLARDSYWGTIDVEFRAGRVVVIRKEETIKINFNSIPDTGSNNEQQRK